MVSGLATVIYYVSDIDAAKAWYARAFGTQPYFDEPFYVGFNIGGYELGLHPETPENRSGKGGGVAYWRVPDVEAALRHFTASGAALESDATDVGEGIRVASVIDPYGNAIGLIENPHFSVASR
jgi:predicted enzyme related to lactoylglutathione lyase